MIKHNTYCKKTDKLAKELTEGIQVLADCKDEFARTNIQTVKDARIRLEVLSSLKNTASRINAFIDEVKQQT